MTGDNFTPHYKDKLFVLWYEKGRPPIKIFWGYMPLDNDGRKPSLTTLHGWVNDTWKSRADANDELANDEMNARLVGEKVEMLTRHAKVGERMQIIAMDFIEEYKDELTSSTAVRMLVEGVRIERDSRGVGTAFRSMLETSDEDLLLAIEELVGKASVEIQQLEDEK